MTNVTAGVRSARSGSPPAPAGSARRAGSRRRPAAPTRGRARCPTARGPRRRAARRRSRPAAAARRATAAAGRRGPTTPRRASAGRKRAPRSSSRGAHAPRVGLLAQERRADGGHAGRRDDAEQRLGRLGGDVLDARLLEHVARRPLEPHLDVHAPHGRDRAARASARRPRAGGDHDRAGVQRGDVLRRPRRCAARRPPRAPAAPRPRRRRRAAPAARWLAERVQAVAEAGLGLRQRRVLEPLGLQLGEARGDVRAGGLERLGVLGEHEQPGRLRRALEAVAERA